MVALEFDWRKFIAAVSPNGSSQMMLQSSIMRQLLTVGFVSAFIITAAGSIGSFVTWSHAAGPTGADSLPAAAAGRAAMIEMPGVPSMGFQDTGGLAPAIDLGPVIRASGKPPQPPRAPGNTFLSNTDLSMLLTRGDSLFGFRDYASARLFYERAASAGSGQAAVRLGQTYDPSFLEWARLRWVRGDAAAAVFWYRRARDLGVSDAETLLKGIEGK